MTGQEPGVAILEARGVRKTFGHVEALRGVDLDIYPAETVALMGDNGAGKSTLMKILCGAHRADAGEVRIDGAAVRIRNPRVARAHGIAVVYQDLALVDTRDVASNVFLGREPIRGGLVDRRRMLRETSAVLDDLDIRIPSLRTPVGRLSGGQRQAVAIARAVNGGGRLLLMDEPTAALGVEEQRKVLQMIRDLRTRGQAILVVSHNLEHVFQVADRIVVLRGGRLAGVRRTADTSADEIVKLIIGGDDFSITVHDSAVADRPTSAGRA